MSTIERISQDEEWKKQLREKFIILMTGSEREKQSLYANIGYVYQCYAPASVYKYYSDSSLNLDALKSNKMWYSAPCNFNDVFDCDVTVDEDQLFKSLSSGRSDYLSFKIFKEAPLVVGTRFYIEKHFMKTGKPASYGYAVITEIIK